MVVLMHFTFFSSFMLKKGNLKLDLDVQNSQIQKNTKRQRFGALSDKMLLIAI